MNSLKHLGLPLIAAGAVKGDRELRASRHGALRKLIVENDRIVGLSKMARVVEFYAKRPQLQERLTEQVVSFLEEKLQPLGAMVVIEARHLCVEMRGVKKPGAVTVTSALRGAFHKRPVREEFLDLVRG